MLLYTLYSYTFEDFFFPNNAFNLSEQGVVHHPPFLIGDRENKEGQEAVIKLVHPANSISRRGLLVQEVCKHSGTSTNALFDYDYEKRLVYFVEHRGDRLARISLPSPAERRGRRRRKKKRQKV